MNEVTSVHFFKMLALLRGMFGEVTCVWKDPTREQDVPVITCKWKPNSSDNGFTIGRAQNYDELLASMTTLYNEKYDEWCDRVVLAKYERDAAALREKLNIHRDR